MQPCKNTEDYPVLDAGCGATSPICLVTSPATSNKCVKCLADASNTGCPSQQICDTTTATHGCVSAFNRSRVILSSLNYQPYCATCSVPCSPLRLPSPVNPTIRCTIGDGIPAHRHASHCRSSQCVLTLWTAPPLAVWLPPIGSCTTLPRQSAHPITSHPPSLASMAHGTLQGTSSSTPSGGLAAPP